MPCKYTLEWLDAAVASSLHYLNCDPSPLGDAYLATVIDNAPLQVASIRSSIKQEAFRLAGERQVEVLVRQYHSSLIALHDTALENSKASEARGGLLPAACKSLSAVLEELLSFVEKWYQRYLSLDERVPLTHIEAFQADLPQRLRRLGDSLGAKTGDSNLATAIIDALAAHGGVPRMTFRELFYRKDILQQLEAMEACSSEACTSKAVNELLAYMNFNSKAYLSYLTGTITDKMAMAQGFADRVCVLLLAQKEFNQIYRREGVRLNIHDADLKAAAGEWFTQELSYLERSRQLAATHEGSGGQNTGTVKKPQKLVCSLSVDQIALLVRSADESKVLLCRSVNSAFKTLVPFLSTEERNDISPDSMRSKSYVAERKDKEIVISKLKEMIEKISGY